MELIPRFNLKWMLLLVAVIAGSMAAITQVGMREGEFVVRENNLFATEDGLVEGALELVYIGDESFGDWVFECKFSKVDKRDLLDLKPGTRSKFRYRAKSLGPLKIQEPCAFFLTRSLGVASDDIVGYVFFKRGTELVINGQP